MVNFKSNDINRNNSFSLSNIIDDFLGNPYLFLFTVGLLTFFVLNLSPIFPSLKFKQTINIAELFWGVAIVLAIVERSIELFIIAWRNPRKEELEQNIAIFEEQVFQSLPEKEKQDFEAKQAKIDQVKHEIETNQEKIKTNHKTIENQQQKLNEQQQKINSLADEAENIQREEAKLETIKSVIETLEVDVLQLEKEIKNKAGRLQALRNEELALLLKVNPVLNPNSPAHELNKYRIKLINHKKNTAKYALYLGLLFGLVGSIAGIRILEPLFDLDSIKNVSNLKQQLQIFQRFDLMVSALGIAGGTKLFHGLPNLISDTLSSTSSQIKAAANSRQSQQP